MATQATLSVTIQAEPDQVWPWISDISRHHEWSPRPYRVERISGEPNGVGSRYHSVGWVPPRDGEHGNDVVITEVVPESRFALLADDESGTYLNTFDLRPVDGATEVTFHIEFPRMRGVNAVLVPLLFPLVAKPDFRRRLALLKHRVEDSA